MIARARAIAHGSAYTTYSTLKRDAEFVCCKNMAGDMTMAVTEDDLDSIWMQFKHAGDIYIAKGKPVTRNLIAMEVSPTKEESKGWSMEQWSLLAHRVIEEMDKIEFRNKEGKVSSRRTDFTHSKWLAMLHHDAKSGIPHLHFMISRFTTDGRINDTNLIGLKATMAANSRTTAPRAIYLCLFVVLFQSCRYRSFQSAIFSIPSSHYECAGMYQTCIRMSS